MYLAYLVKYCLRRLVGEGKRRSFAMPTPFVLTNKICLSQILFKPITSSTLLYSVFFCYRVCQISRITIRFPFPPNRRSLSRRYFLMHQNRPLTCWRSSCSIQQRNVSRLNRWGLTAFHLPKVWLQMQARLTLKVLVKTVDALQHF